MTFEEFVSSGIPALAALTGIGWFLWQRYQALERRFSSLEKELIELRHRGEITRQAFQSNHEDQEYKIHGLNELIKHRTDRFTDSLKALEGRLGQEVKEIRNWLDQNTEFKIRDR